MYKRLILNKQPLNSISVLHARADDTDSQELFFACVSHELAPYCDIVFQT
jgi:hypothetical protein